MAKNFKQSFKEILITFGPAVLILVLGFWLASRFISPAPPKKIVMATGEKTGAYYKFADRYRQELAKKGIEVEIKATTGSLENIDLLLQGKADVAFVQGGTGKDGENLLSLGSLYYEPVWIFLNRQIAAEQLKDYDDLIISIGEKGSGTSVVANKLLEMNDIDNKSATLVTMNSSTAVKNLLAHKIDAAFFVSSAKSTIIQKLLKDDRVHLLNMSRAEAYSYLMPYLSKITLAEGIIDLNRNIPSQDIAMIAPTANLAINEDLHSALQILILEAAKKIHGGPGLFSDPDTFPSSYKTAFPLSEIAERYYKVGPPFLMRYLPFWAAVLIDRLVVMLIPLVALLLPLMKVMPPIYRWRIRRSIYQWYDELQEVDNETFEKPISEEKFTRLFQELKRIEEEVNKVKTPLSYADQLYNLLLHIDLVKKKMIEEYMEEKKPEASIQNLDSTRNPAK